MSEDNLPAVREDNLPAKGGRPKGSKNRITVLKLMMEESVRSGSAKKIKQVLEDIIEDALQGDRDCRKLVWQSVMSKSGFDQSTPTGAVPEIVIRSDKPPEIRTVKVVDAEIEEETPNGRLKADE